MLQGLLDALQQREYLVDHLARKVLEVLRHQQLGGPGLLALRLRLQQRHGLGLQARLGQLYGLAPQFGSMDLDAIDQREHLVGRMLNGSERIGAQRDGFGCHRRCLPAAPQSWREARC